MSDERVAVALLDVKRAVRQRRLALAAPVALAGAVLGAFVAAPPQHGGIALVAEADASDDAGLPQVFGANGRWRLAEPIGETQTSLTGPPWLVLAPEGPAAPDFTLVGPTKPLDSSLPTSGSTPPTSASGESADLDLSKFWPRVRLSPPAPVGDTAPVSAATSETTAAGEAIDAGSDGDTAGGTPGDTAGGTDSSADGDTSTRATTTVDGAGIAASLVSGDSVPGGSDSAVPVTQGGQGAPGLRGDSAESTDHLAATETAVGTADTAQANDPLSSQAPTDSTAGEADISGESGDSTSPEATRSDDTRPSLEPDPRLEPSEEGVTAETPETSAMPEVDTTPSMSSTDEDVTDEPSGASEPTGGDGQPELPPGAGGESSVDTGVEQGANPSTPQTQPSDTAARPSDSVATIVAGLVLVHRAHVSVTVQVVDDDSSVIDWCNTWIDWGDGSVTGTTDPDEDASCAAPCEREASSSEDVVNETLEFVHQYSVVIDAAPRVVVATGDGCDFAVAELQLNPFTVVPY